MARDIPLRIKLIGEDSILGTQLSKEEIRYVKDKTIIPEGWEWAREAVHALDLGIQKLQSREAEFFAEKNPGKNISPQDMHKLPLETFARFGVITIAQDNSIRKDESVPYAHQAYAGQTRVYLESGETPGIVLNNLYLRKHPDNAAFLLAQQLAIFFDDMQPREMKARDPLRGPALLPRDPLGVHSNNTLFKLAHSLDELDASIAHPDQSLFNFTRRRMNLGQDDSTDRQQLLGDMYGNLMLGSNDPSTPIEDRTQGKDTLNFPVSPNFHLQQFPVYAPLTKEYMRGPFALDLIYRGMLQPGDALRDLHDTMIRKISDESAGMKPELYNEIQDFIIESYKPGKKIDRKMLAYMKEMVSQAIHKGIEPFEIKLLAQHASQGIMS